MLTVMYFLFNLASDGQQIYLHRMNQDCLLHEYGTFNNCPPTLTARIVQKDDQNVRYVRTMQN